MSETVVAAGLASADGECQRAALIFIRKVNFKMQGRDIPAGFDEPESPCEPLGGFCSRMVSRFVADSPLEGAGF
jgi:hypothetical protein